MVSAGAAALLATLSLLAIGVWWIVDAITFVTNQRLGGDGCPLRPIL